MNKSVVTEIVQFNTVPGVSGEEFIRIVDSLEENFHSRQSGFIDTELVKGKEESQWLMIQHWESMAECKAVVQLMMKTPFTEEFRRALDPKSVKMSLLESVRFWQKR